MKFVHTGKNLVMFLRALLFTTFCVLSQFRFLIQFCVKIKLTIKQALRYYPTIMSDFGDAESSLFFDDFGLYSM